MLGCKRLNASDDLILKQHKINVESGEDVFRFHLVPEYNSDLPRITNSVLKTRSTLSLHKVYKYLTKKLQEATEDNLQGQLSDLVIITCHGQQLDSSLQLREAREIHWPFSDKLLTLQYKRKTAALDRRKPTEQLRPPVWVPRHLAFNCRDCDSEFSFLWNRVHHCRNCGQCFCEPCSKDRAAIPRFGYLKPVRVCRNCSL